MNTVLRKMKTQRLFMHLIPSKRKSQLNLRRERKCSKVTVRTLFLLKR